MKSVYSNIEGLPPDRIVPTVGLNIGRIEVSNRKLVFWDLGGQVWAKCIGNTYLCKFYNYDIRMNCNFISQSNFAH